MRRSNFYAFASYAWRTIMFSLCPVVPMYALLSRANMNSSAGWASPLQRQRRRHHMTVRGF